MKDSNCQIFSFFIIFFLHLFINIAISAQPQNFVLTQISEDQGLPGTTVRAIFQDKNDIFWFGVESKGLCKYDGHRFTLFANNPDDSTSISNNFVNVINQDSLGYLWIGTDEGLCRLNPQTERFYRFYSEKNNNNTISGNQINNIAINKKNEIWVCTNNGLNKYDNKTNSFFHIPLLIKGVDYKCMVNSVSFDSGNNLWIATNNGLLFYDCYNKTTKLWINDPNDILSLPYNYISSLFYDIDSTLWLCSLIGVTRYDCKTDLFQRVIYDFNTGYFSNLFPFTLLKDMEGHIWTGEQMIAIYNPKTLKASYFKKSYYDPEGLKSIFVRAIYEDKSGLIWIGSKFSGVQIYNKNREIFPHWKNQIDVNRPGLNDLFVNCFYEDQDQKLWIGTLAGGINIFDRKTGKFSYLTHDPKNPKSISTNDVRCFLPDKDGDLWVGTLNNIEKYNFKTKKFTHFPFGSIKCMADDGRGRLLIGSAVTGLSLFNTKSKKIEPIIDSKGLLPDNKKQNIYVTYKDNDSIIWIATHRDGLYKYNVNTGIEEAYKNDPNDASSLSNNQVRSIIRDSKGRLWIGTKSKGLNLFNEKECTFKHYTEKDGLPTNVIYSMLEDKYGNLWIATHNGLSKFLVNENRFENYNKDFGLQSNIFVTTANYRCKSGELVFGGENGFNIFNPSKIHKPTIKSHIIISNIKIFDKIAYRDIVDKQSISLPYNKNYLTFEYSLLDYTSPNRNQYKFKMEGIDNDWILCGNRNYASYSSLNPGLYSFKVMGANAYGVWQESVVEIEIRILPPWWKTWVFRIILILFIFASIVGFYLFRLRILREQKKQLEQLVRIRTKELEEKNNKLEYQEELLRSKTNELLENNEVLNETNTVLEERQQRIEEQSEELKAQAEDLNEKNKELKLLVATKDKFFSIIAHDLKNSLSQILGFSELFVQKYNRFTEEKRLHYAEVIFKSTKQLFDLLENLLQWARSQTGNIQFNPELISLKEIVESNFELHKNQADKKGIVFINNIFEDTEVFADRNMIHAVVRNLISNAIKYTEDGSIELSCKIKSDMLEIRIQDSGVGIPNQKLQSLFNIEKNKSTEGTKGETGTGLGLIICKEFIEKHKGHIWVESSEGNGCTFIFTLPV